MDRLSDMKLALDVAEAGSFSAAARKIGAPLSTVSRRINDLEAHLQTQIFSRNGRRLVITDAGRIYLEYCARILDDVSEAERLVAGEYVEPTGQLTVAAPLVFGRLYIAPLLSAFADAYPCVDVRLELSDRVADFSEGKIDTAIRIGHLPETDLVAIRVGRTCQVTCASPTYLATKGVPERPEELKGHQCVTFDHLNSPSNWEFAKEGQIIDAPIRSRFVVTTADAAIEACENDAGITRIFCYQMAPRERKGRLVRILIDFEPEKIPIHLLYARNGRVPKKVRAFVDFMKPRLKNSLSQ